MERQEGHTPDEYEPCHFCGGAGVMEDECTCLDDTCCCRFPTPPLCPECNGGGALSDIAKLHEMKEE